MLVANAVQGLPTCPEQVQSVSTLEGIVRQTLGRAGHPKLSLPFLRQCHVLMLLTGVTNHMDDEYRWAGVEDPKVMITTSRDPSSRLKMFAKVPVAGSEWEILRPQRSQS